VCWQALPRTGRAVQVLVRVGLLVGHDEAPP